MHTNPFDLDKKRDGARDAEMVRAFDLELEEADLVAVMQSSSGRRVMRRLIDQMGRRDSSFSTDALRMAGRARTAEFALALELVLERVAPAETLQMHQERIEADIRDRELRAKP